MYTCANAFSYVIHIIYMTVLNRSWKSNIVHCCTKCKYRQHMLKITSTLCVNHLAMQHTSTNVSNMSATSQKTTHQMMTSRTIDSKTPASVRMAQKPVNHENVYHIGLYCHVGWLVRFLHHQQYHHALNSFLGGVQLSTSSAKQQVLPKFVKPLGAGPVL